MAVIGYMRILVSTKIPPNMIMLTMMEYLHIVIIINVFFAAELPVSLTNVWSSFSIKKLATGLAKELNKLLLPLLCSSQGP